MPVVYSPQLPTLVARPPAGPGWIHEIKHDGYRMGAVVSAGTARLWSRAGKEWTSGFPNVVETLAKLPVSSAVLDGEVVFLRDDGTTDFGSLRSVVGKRSPRVAFYLFDVLELDGRDVRACPLLERKELLRGVVPNQTGALRVVEHVAGEGALVFEAAKRLGAEGIVSKQERSLYRGGRTTEWLKTKAVQHEEFAVCGYLVSAGAPLAALLLAVEDEGQWRYVGKVGTGFQREQRELLATLKGLEVAACPLPTTSRPKGRDFREARWTRTSMVVEVEYLEMGTESLRHPVFRGIR